MNPSCVYICFVELDARTSTPSWTRGVLVILIALMIWQTLAVEEFPAALFLLVLLRIKLLSLPCFELCPLAFV